MCGHIDYTLSLLIDSYAWNEILSIKSTKINTHKKSFQYMCSTIGNDNLFIQINTPHWPIQMLYKNGIMKLTMYTVLYPFNYIINIYIT
jgi:hypothetical protein